MGARGESGGGVVEGKGGSKGGRCAWGARGARGAGGARVNGMGGRAVTVSRALRLPELARYWHKLGSGGPEKQATGGSGERSGVLGTAEALDVTSGQVVRHFYNHLSHPCWYHSCRGCTPRCILCVTGNVHWISRRGASAAIFLRRRGGGFRTG